MTRFSTWHYCLESISVSRPSRCQCSSSPNNMKEYQQLACHSQGWMAAGDQEPKIYSATSHCTLTLSNHMRRDCNHTNKVQNLATPIPSMYQVGDKFQARFAWRISCLHEATETPTFYIVEYTFGSNRKRSLTSNAPHPTLKLCKRMEMDQGLETHQHRTKLGNSIYPWNTPTWYLNIPCTWIHFRLQT